MKNRKILFLLLALFMVLVLFVSCGNMKTEDRGTDVKEEQTSQPVEKGNDAVKNVDEAADKANLEAERLAKEAEEAAKKAKEEAEKSVQKVEAEAEKVFQKIEVEAEKVAEKIAPEAEKDTEIGYMPKEFRNVEDENDEDTIHFSLLALNPDLSDDALSGDDDKAVVSGDNSDGDSANSEADAKTNAKAKAEEKAKAKAEEKAKAKAEREAAKKAREEELARDNAFVLFGSEKKKSFSFYFMPYGYRGIIPDRKDIKEVTSEYGIGAKFKIRSMLNKTFYTAFEATGVTYFLNKTYDTSNYTDVVFAPKLGLNLQLNKMFAPYVETAFGIDLTCFDTLCVAQWITQLELGVGIAVDEHWTFETSLEGSWSWHSEGADRFYYPASAWMINGYIGGTYKF